MANFRTHLNIAVISLGVAAIAVYPYVGITAALCFWLAGINGGLLPDIDADNSTSLNIIFNIVSGSIILSIIYASKLSSVDTVFLSIVVYLFLKYVLRKLFEKFTCHRGTCHSILFLLWSALLLTNTVYSLSADVLNNTEVVAWLSGIGLFLGGLIHLTLDEIYSVDISNMRIKRSFGSAFKLYSKNRVILTMTMSASCVFLWLISPKVPLMLLKFIS